MGKPANLLAQREFVFVDTSETNRPETRMVIRSLAGTHGKQHPEHTDIVSHGGNAVPYHRDESWVPYHKLRIAQASKHSRRGQRSQTTSDPIDAKRLSVAGKRGKRGRRYGQIGDTLSSEIERIGASSVDPFRSLPDTIIPDSIISSSVSFGT